jgi:hypothetical protein
MENRSAPRRCHRLVLWIGRSFSLFRKPFILTHKHRTSQAIFKELEDEGEFVPQLVTLVSDIARLLPMLMMGALGGEYAKDVQQDVL